MAASRESSTKRTRPVKAAGVLAVLVAGACGRSRAPARPAVAPPAIALGHGSQLMQPLAIAVIGGFVLSGPVVLLVLPALYRLLDPAGRLGKHAEFRL